jgi:hypothetical protein
MNIEQPPAHALTACGCETREWETIYGKESCQQQWTDKSGQHPEGRKRAQKEREQQHPGTCKGRREDGRKEAGLWKDKRTRIFRTPVCDTAGQSGGGAHGRS